MQTDVAEISKPYSGVVFDFDGTLFNLQVDWDRLRRILASRFPGYSFDRITHGLTELENTKGPVLLREAFDLIHHFEIAKPAEPIEKMIDLACECCLRGQRIAIFSSNMHATITETLRREGIPDLFDTIIGGDSVRFRKPHPEGLIRAMNALGTNAENTLYIADGEFERETGRRVEIRTWLVSAA